MVQGTEGKVLYRVSRADTCQGRAFVEVDCRVEFRMCRESEQEVIYREILAIPVVRLLVPLDPSTTLGCSCNVAFGKAEQERGSQIQGHSFGSEGDGKMKGEGHF